MGRGERLYTESYRCIADSLTYPPHCPPHWSSHWSALESCTHWASVTTESPSSWTCSPPTAMGGRGGEGAGRCTIQALPRAAMGGRGGEGAGRCTIQALPRHCQSGQRQGMTLSHYRGRLSGMVTLTTSPSRWILQSFLNSSSI